MCGAIPTQCPRCGMWWRITGQHDEDKCKEEEE